MRADRKAIAKIAGIAKIAEIENQNLTAEGAKNNRSSDRKQRIHRGAKDCQDCKRLQNA
jgi:hypothetical protein